jgi:hypothetical protein
MPKVELGKFGVVAGEELEINSRWGVLFCVLGLLWALHPAFLLLLAIGNPSFYLINGK